MKAVAKTERLPRWSDCVVFAGSGLLALPILWLAHGADAALWFGPRWGGLTVPVIAVTVLRQRRI
ncbi:hypothetical protein [Burkholderia sp. AU6039]|uniref:hypothetical protein n=1 Tax=Burkholderia sp. AU6039 TaxID=2015344 RepID=UPI000B7A0861|nr:hypothetical protein [Burkholderia sp. AU6039]OXJ20144.1 hypothetical protein CFB39_09360 [Burkholderia sp. AU6039]